MTFSRAHPSERPEGRLAVVVQRQADAYMLTAGSDRPNRDTA